MRKALWIAISLLVVVVLLVGGCAGHPKGMKSLRWLTDAEKDRLIEIALNTPEALRRLEEESHYKASVGWAAINWLDHDIEVCYFDYECVEKGVPANVPESAEFYSQVEIYFGEPAHYQLNVAINPDTRKVAFVECHGLRTIPTAPSQTPTLTPAPAINEAKAIALAAKVVPIEVIGRAQVSAEFAPQSGPHGAWLVVFDSVNVTRDELGWPENPSWEFGLSRPEGDYETLVINVDAGTGDIYLKLAGSYRHHMMSP